MSSVTFTIGDWQKVCSAFDLDMASVMSVLNGGAQRAARSKVSREAAVVPSVTAVSDSESDTAPSDNFATSKTRAFAALHNIACETLTGTGKKGKVTMEDVKKALPPKKRGRKPKPKTEEALDVVDSLPAEAGSKAKKVKDPNAPKKASNAWILYLNAHRDEFRGKHPDMKMPELTKLISVQYKALTAEEKAPWDDKVTADKERYAQELATYQASKQSPTASPKADKADKADATLGSHLTDSAGLSRAGANSTQESELRHSGERAPAVQLALLPEQTALRRASCNERLTGPVVTS